MDGWIDSLPDHHHTNCNLESVLYLSTKIFDLQCSDLASDVIVSPVQVVLAPVTQRPSPLQMRSLKGSDDATSSHRVETGTTMVNDCANGRQGGIKETVPGIRADLEVARSLFCSGTAIRADLRDWELAVNVDGSFARWWIIVAINNTTLASPLL